MRVRPVAGLAATAAGMLLLAGCSGPGTSREKPDPSPTTQTTPAKTGADPAHAVAAPGPRKGRLWSADILVQWDEPLDDELVAEIAGLEGVAHTERIGLGQVSLENRVLTIAAVDPGAYRHFARADVADLQEAWDRVAGGELAVDRAVARRLQDEDGMIELGEGPGAPSIHVGAYTPQLPTIDMVVNSTWAADIEMATDNGLLISTDSITPSSIRSALERLVGDDASVQMLDVASRIGLDPEASLTVVPTGETLGSLVGTFGYRVLGGGRIAPDTTWVAANIRTEQVPILGEVTCHRGLFPQLRAALLEVQSRGLADRIQPDEFAGCYYPRFIAGTTTLSNHAFGLALDINAADNQRGTAGGMDRDVVGIFESWGFAWGGDWRWSDPMHFELREITQVGRGASP